MIDSCSNFQRGQWGTSTSSPLNASIFVPWVLWRFDQGGGVDPITEQLSGSPRPDCSALRNTRATCVKIQEAPVQNNFPLINLSFVIKSLKISWQRTGRKKKHYIQEALDEHLSGQLKTGLKYQLKKNKGEGWKGAFGWPMGFRRNKGG